MFPRTSRASRLQRPARPAKTKPERRTRHCRRSYKMQSVCCLACCALEALVHVAGSSWALQRRTGLVSLKQGSFCFCQTSMMWMQVSLQVEAVHLCSCYKLSQHFWSRTRGFQNNKCAIRNTASICSMCTASTRLILYANSSSVLERYTDKTG